MQIPPFDPTAAAATRPSPRDHEGRSARDPTRTAREEGDAGRAEAAEPTYGGKPQTDPRLQAVVAELRRRDQEVRAHEAAHAAAGGAYVRGGPSYSYTAGPDGKRYATGGEVQIDTSPVAGDPAATAAKMAVVRAAALAPANPSGQDVAVAAQASQTEAQARLEAAVAARYESGGGGAAPGTALDHRA